MNEKVKLLIADDHQMFIDGIKALLRKEEGVEVTGEAKNGLEALQILAALPINILITDLSMPEMGGLELIKKVKKQHPDTKVLVVSMYNDRNIIADVMMAEAEGFILKNTGKKELTDALHQLSDNGTYYSREILQVMMERVMNESKIQQETKSLTEREKEILRLIAQEKSSEEIAEALHISKRTVDSHRKNIIEKTGVSTIVGLIKYAIRNNLAEL